MWHRLSLFTPQRVLESPHLSREPSAPVYSGNQNLFSYFPCHQRHFFSERGLPETPCIQTSSTVNDKPPSLALSIVSHLYHSLNKHLLEVCVPGFVLGSERWKDKWNRIPALEEHWSLVFSMEGPQKLLLHLRTFLRENTEKLPRNESTKRQDPCLDSLILKTALEADAGFW